MAQPEHRHPVGGLFTQAERRAKVAEKITTLDRLEHVFGDQSYRFQARLIATIGQARAWLQIGLGNLLYNFTRFSFFGCKMS